MFRVIALTVAFIAAIIGALFTGFTITEVCAFGAFIVAVDAWVKSQVNNVIVGAIINNLAANSKKVEKDARKAE